MPDYGVHNSLLVDACREGLWFWDVVILLQTFAISTALVFSTRLNTHYQLSIMLMIMLAGITALAHMAPFKESLSQRVQVNTACNDRTTLALLLATQNQHCSPATRLVRALSGIDTKSLIRHVTRTCTCCNLHCISLLLCQLVCLAVQCWQTLHGLLVVLGGIG